MKSKKIVIVAGTGRSGTTWIAEVLNYRDEFEYIFEPFKTDAVDLGSFFRHKPYLRPNAAHRDYKKTIERLIRGELQNEWTHRYESGGLKEWILIKTIRANLFLKWMKVQSPEFKIILVLRHPCAVALSQIQQNWRIDLDALFLSQPLLLQDYLAPFSKAARSVSSEFEKHIFLWCFENYVPLRQFNFGEFEVVFYEDLCLNPRSEIDRLSSFLGVEFDDRIFQSIKIPSSQSHRYSAILTGRPPHDAWTTKLMPEEVERSVKILAMFGLDPIYSAYPLPNRAGLENILTKSD